MKFEFQGYEIDTQKETDHLDLSAKLTVLLLNYYPTWDIYAAHYDYSEKEDKARIVIKRHTKYFIQGGWISSKDCQILTSLPEEYFYPKAFGGKDEGYFGLIGYHHEYYANDDKLISFIKELYPSEGVKDVRVAADDKFLVIEYKGK